MLIDLFYSLLDYSGIGAKRDGGVMVAFPRIGRTDSWLKKKLWQTEDQFCYVNDRSNNGSPNNPTVAGLWFAPRLGNRIDNSILDASDYATYSKIQK